MLSTVNDIINISKIEAGQVEVFVSDINLNKQMDELFEFSCLRLRKRTYSFPLLTGYPINKPILNRIRKN